MVTRLDAVRAGWFFLAYVNRRKYLETFKNDPNFNEEDFHRPVPEISKLFTNPAMPVEEVDRRLLEHRSKGKVGGNEIILMGLHGQPEHIVSWFNVGKVTTKVLGPIERNYEIVMNTYRSRLGEAGLNGDRIDKLVETVKKHHAAISSKSGDTRPFLEVPQLLFSYAADAEKEANRPTVDTEIIIGEKVMGDKFENVSDSTIINRSLLSNALNRVTLQYGDDVKNALDELSKYIESTGEVESADLFDGFNKELGNEEANKSVLKALWEGLVSKLPDAAKITTAIATISKIFT